MPQLARHLAVRFRARIAADDEAFTPEALEALCRHSWPGNVRELANVIEHAMILCERLPIDVEHLPHRFDLLRIGADEPAVRSQGGNLREMEMQAIHQALARHNGNKPKAAEELGISLKTLYNKLNQATTMSKTA